MQYNLGLLQKYGTQINAIFANTCMYMYRTVAIDTCIAIGAFIRTKRESERRP